MRDRRFVAVHRGGPLQKEQHIQLMKRVIHCSEHVLHLAGRDLDVRLITILDIAKGWTLGKSSGVAMKASVHAHAIARESSTPLAIELARSVGQTVATAHMADHSLGGAIYALKAVKYVGKSVDQERERQNKQLPLEIMELVLSTRTNKEQGFKDIKI